MPSCSGVEPHRSNNMTSSDFIPSTPLQPTTVKSVPKVDNAVDLNIVRCNTTVTHHSHSQMKNPTDSTHPALLGTESHVRAGSTAVPQKLPLNHPYIKNAEMTVNTCQQEEPILANDGDVDIFAANDTVPLSNVAPHDVNKATHYQLTVQNCSLPNDDEIDVMLFNGTSAPSPSCSKSLQDDNNPRTVPQLEVLLALHVTSTTGTETTTVMTSYVDSQCSKLGVTEGGQLAQSAAQTDSAISRALDNRNDSTVQPGHGDKSMSVRPSNATMDQIWRKTPNGLKYLQSLHSLRKAWLEWETKFRPLLYPYTQSEVLTHRNYSLAPHMYICTTLRCNSLIH